MKRIFFTLLVIVSFLSKETKPVFVTYSILKKDEQKIILLGDFHKPHIYSEIQRNKIINQLKQLNKEDILTLVEDMCDTNEYNKNDEKYIKIIRFFKKFPKKSPLQSLHTDLIKNNIHSINIENRHIQSYFTCSSRLIKIPPLSIIDEIQKNIKRVEAYKEKLPESTQKKATNIILDIEKFVQNYTKTPLIQRLLSTDSDKCDFLRKSTPLLDLEFIHNILQNQNKKRIYIFAGFFHTQEIEKILIQDMGYKKDISSN